MKNIRRYSVSFILLCLVLIVSSCAPALSEPSPLTQQQAFKQLFPKAVSNQPFSKQLTREEYSEIKSHISLDIYDVWRETLVTPLAIQTLKNRSYLLYQTLPKEGHDCHACGALIGGAVFVFDKGQWNIQSHELSIAYLGAWGEVSSPKWIEMDKERGGFLFESGFVAQGYLSEHMSLITNVEGKLKKVWQSEAGGNNFGTGMEPRWEWQSSLKFEAQIDSFPKLVLTRWGTEVKPETPDKIKPFDEEVTFVFDGQEYQKLNH